MLGAAAHDVTAPMVAYPSTVHPKGYVPHGFDLHPIYRTARVAQVPLLTADVAAFHLAEALDQAPLVPWVRAERHLVLDETRRLMRHGEVEIPVHTEGTVDAATLVEVRSALALYPPLYHALWRAAHNQFSVIGHSQRAVPEVVASELRARTRGAFVANRQAAYVLLPNLRDMPDVRSTAMEEAAHGLDFLLGFVHGIEGPRPGRIPAETVARSNQTDFRALWERRRNRATIARRSRQDVRELFAYAFIRYYGSPDILKEDDRPLYRFVAQLEMEVAAHVGTS